MIKQKTRNEIDDKYKWDLTAIFKNDEEFLNELEKCKDIAHGLSKFKGHILDSADSLYDYFKTKIDDNNIKYWIYQYENKLYDGKHFNNIILNDANWIFKVLHNTSSDEKWNLFLKEHL